MGKKLLMLLSFMVVISVSGCTDTNPDTEVVSTDLLEIVDIVAMPADTVKPGDKIVIRMEVKNRGQNDVYMLVDEGGNLDGDMILVNYCKGIYSLDKEDAFTVVSVSSDDYLVDVRGDYAVKLSTKDMSNPAYIRFIPGQTHVFQWSLRAPTDLRGLRSECELDFQTIYATYAKTISYVYFASPKELVQKIYTKEDLTEAGDNVASFGPVVVNFNTASQQPIRAGTHADAGREVPDTWTFYLTVSNLGSGTAKLKNLEFEYPESFELGDEYENNGLDVNDDDGSLDVEDRVCDLYLDDDVLQLAIEDIEERLLHFYDMNAKDCVTYYESKGGYDADQINTICSIYGCSYITGSPLWEQMCEYYENLNARFEIYHDSTSRIICEMPVPGDVVVMKPYRFVSKAYYSYFNEQSLAIVTDPNL